MRSSSPNDFGVRSFFYCKLFRLSPHFFLSPSGSHVWLELSTLFFPQLTALEVSLGEISNSPWGSLGVPGAPGMPLGFVSFQMKDALLIDVFLFLTCGAGAPLFPPTRQHNFHPLPCSSTLHSSNLLSSVSLPPPQVRNSVRPTRFPLSRLVCFVFFVELSLCLISFNDSLPLFFSFRRPYGPHCVFFPLLFTLASRFSSQAHLCGSFSPDQGAHLPFDRLNES